VVNASRYGLGVALLMVAVLPAAHAVMFQSTDDPAYNTTEPAGTLTDSGWRLEGLWSSYLGTPVAPTFFVAAKHIGGNVGDLFILNDFVYHTTAMVSNPSADLIVWQVAETFPTYASLYTKIDEVDKSCAVFGRGTQRGPAVIVAGVTNGWQWGTADGVKRWGENDVAAIVTGGATLGDFLQATFDRTAGTNECHLSVGDSSGALFIQDGSEWKLAGIHYAVDAHFSFDGTTNTQFDAALLDMGGLYIGENTTWTFITNEVADIPSAFYSTRISSQAAWINNVINFEPGIDLRITGIQPAGNDVQITFMTGLDKIYRIDWCADLKTNAWETLTNGVVGTGGAMTATDTGAASLPNRFYRVGLVP
jgi:hypothetical protein